MGGVVRWCGDGSVDVAIIRTVGTVVERPPDDEWANEEWTGSEGRHPAGSVRISGSTGVESVLSAWGG